MKIAYICSDIDITVFGTEGCSVHIREVAEALCGLGHEVVVISPCLGKRPAASSRARYVELAPQGLNERAWRFLEEEPLVREGRMARDLKSVFFNAWLQAAAAKLFLDEKPDLIYERYALFGWSGAALSRQYGIPLILEVNAPLTDEQEGYDQFTLVETARGMEMEILRAADAVLPVSDRLKQWIIGMGADPARISVVPNGISRQRFSVMASGEKFRKQYDLTGNWVIGYVGSFQSWHDTTGLLSAFAKLYREQPRVRLLLVGEGELKASMQERVRQAGLESAVTFTGHVSHERMPDCLAAMDIAVVPYAKLSNFYFSPIKLFECMAAGKPTVAADIGQISAVIVHGETGWLYPPGERDALCQSLRTLFHDAALAARIGAAGRAAVLAGYTWEAVAAKIVRIGESLTQRASEAG